MQININVSCIGKVKDVNIKQDYFKHLFSFRNNFPLLKLVEKYWSFKISLHYFEI